MKSIYYARQHQVTTKNDPNVRLRHSNSLLPPNHIINSERLAKT